MGARNGASSSPRWAVREARFVRNRDGSPDAACMAVHDHGPDRRGGCNIAQPNFAAELGATMCVPDSDAVVRAWPDREISDGALEANLAQRGAEALRSHLGVSTATAMTAHRRFGWKAQNKSLLLFAGEAYNVEMGITNELFRTSATATELSVQVHAERRHADGVGRNRQPSASFQSDIDLFAAFMRLSAPRLRPRPLLRRPRRRAAQPWWRRPQPMFQARCRPRPEPRRYAVDRSTGTSVTRAARFLNIGCQACHTKSLTTAQSR